MGSLSVLQLQPLTSIMINVIGLNIMDYGAFAPMDFNLRFLLLTADSGFLRARRCLIYQSILIECLLKHRFISKLGTWAKKLPIWQLIPSTIDNKRRINLGHQEINTWCPF